MIKNIVFDLGNVIAKGHSASILDELNISSDEKEYIKERFFSYSLDLDLGNISIEDYYQKRNINLSNDLKDIIIHYYVDRKFDEDLINLINKLKENNYKVFILSNNNKEVREYITNLPFFKEKLDGYVFSCDYKMVKPNKDIYEILLNKYDLIAEESVFIDDKKENIDASIDLGFKGFIYNDNASELIDYLKKNNVNI